MRNFGGRLLLGTLLALSAVGASLLMAKAQNSISGLLPDLGGSDRGSIEIGRTGAKGRSNGRARRYPQPLRSSIKPPLSTFATNGAQ